MKKIVLFLILLCPLIVEGKTINDFDTIKNYSSSYLSTLKDSNKYLETNNSPFLYKNGILSLSNDFKTSGLINLSEYIASQDEQGNTYLNKGLDYWTMTNSANNYYVIDGTKKEQYVLKSINEKSGYRPTIYIKNNLTYKGTGSYVDPWILENPGYKLVFNPTDGNAFDATTCGNGFVLENGLCTKEIRTNEKYGNMPVSRKKYYDFAGWYNSPECGSKVDSNTVFKATKDITLYAMYTRKSTGVPTKTYTVGEEIKYGGMDWYVVKNASDSVTLISKNNVSESSFGKTNKWATSTINDYLNNVWIKENEVIYADYLMGNLIKNTTTKTYVRLINTNELKTSMKNGSNTNFWTMTVSGTKLYYGLADATTKYYDYTNKSTAKCYTGQYTSSGTDSNKVKSTAIGMITKIKQTISAKPAIAAVIEPTAVKARTNGVATKIIDQNDCSTTAGSTVITKYTCSKYPGVLYDKLADATSDCAGTKGYTCKDIYKNAGTCYVDKISAQMECDRQSLVMCDYPDKSGHYVYGNSLRETCESVCNVPEFKCGYYSHDTKTNMCLCNSCKYGGGPANFKCFVASVEECYLAEDPNIKPEALYIHTATPTGKADTYDEYSFNNDVYSVLGVRPVITVKKDYNLPISIVNGGCAVPFDNIAY